MAVASSSQNTYSNEKVKAELTTDFLDVHQYIKTFHIYKPSSNHDLILLLSNHSFFQNLLLSSRFSSFLKGNKVSLAIETTFFHLD
jgi:hypothetical protein